MKIALFILIGLILFAAAGYGAGLLIAREHVASVTGIVAAPPDKVFARIDQVTDYPQWRTGTTAARRVTEHTASERYEEVSSFGPIQYDIVERTAPTRRVTRIVDGGGFGGTWTFELQAVPEGTRITITEAGYIDSPVFRLMGKWVFGFDKTLKGYLGDLQATQHKI